MRHVVCSSDGPDGGSPLLVELCGDPALPGVYRTTGREAFVRFQSDGSVVDTGFQLFWEQKSGKTEARQNSFCQYAVMQCSLWRPSTRDEDVDVWQFKTILRTSVMCPVHCFPACNLDPSHCGWLIKIPDVVQTKGAEIRPCAAGTCPAPPGSSSRPTSRPTIRTTPSASGPSRWTRPAPSSWSRSLSTSRTAVNVTTSRSGADHFPRVDGNVLDVTMGEVYERRTLRPCPHRRNDTTVAESGSHFVQT